MSYSFKYYYYYFSYAHSVTCNLKGNSLDGHKAVGNPQNIIKTNPGGDYHITNTKNLLKMPIGISL